MRVRAAICLALVMAFGGAAVALATVTAYVDYDKPVITFADRPEVPSTENVTVTKDGNEYSFLSTTGAVPDEDSRPGCTDNFATDYRCPVRGIEKIILDLGVQGDTASIDLGSKADDVKQLLRGGDDEDTLTGGDGKQVIKGQGDNDDLVGGSGPDVLNGGPGIDICDGGAGNDELINCEPAPF